MMKRTEQRKTSRSFASLIGLFFRFILAAFIFFVLASFTICVMYMIGRFYYLTVHRGMGRPMNPPAQAPVNPRPTQ